MRSRARRFVAFLRPDAGRLVGSNPLRLRFEAHQNAIPSSRPIVFMRAGFRVGFRVGIASHAGKVYNRFGKDQP
jgi:hypothetical protein